ncbi:hypothetical protein [Nocardia stercoris]|uniref:hypothetical protein n=1 Tax=Nocardia stercoris TaxID=2483361 RepID=UPI000EFAE7C1|nr:hypothetical protein [Nocardia stercoris]
MRTLLVAGCAGVALTFGAGPVALGAPDPAYPWGTQSPGQAPKDRTPEKAQGLAGGIIGTVIDLGTNMLKCGLNMALPTVKCPTP